MLPFSGYKAVEVGARISSGFCGRLLSDYGAEVTLVEPEQGNSLRHYGPYRNGANTEKSGLFGYLHAGKKSVVVEQSSVEILHGMLASADVLIFGAANTPTQQERDLFKAISQSHNQLIAIHISAYGMTGPYSDMVGNELTANALSGMTQRIGKPGLAPLTMPLAQAGYQAGYAAASAAASALLQRLGDVSGQLIEVSETEALATVHAGYAVTRLQRAGISETRAGHRMGSLPYPQTVLPCADGYIELNTPETKQWLKLIEMMGSPRWARDEKYRSRGRNSKPILADELDSYFIEWLKSYSKEEFYAMCRQHGVPSGPVRSINELVNDEQLQDRDFFTSIEFPDGEKISVPDSACSLLRTPARREQVVPGLGEGTESMLANLGVRSAPVEELKGRPSTRGPLEGLRILDMGWVWAGAIPGQILADMGAEVIKVESSKRLDYMRLGRPLVGDKPDPEQNPWFHAVNRNKKSITVNLKSEEGVKLLKRLVSQCDGLIENFKPGFMAKIGLDYQSLSKVNPKLVMLSLSGVGQTGPLSDIPAYAPFLSGLSGLDSVVGYPGEGILGIQQPYADTNAGVSGAFGLIVALLEQKRSGLGQHIDLAESEAAISVIGEAVVEYGMTGEVPLPQGNDRFGFAPHGHYPVLGDDNWVAIAVDSDRQWQSLCEVLDQSALAGSAEFASADDRWKNRRLLDIKLFAITAAFDGVNLFQSLQNRGVAAMPLLGPAEILKDAHYKARKTFKDLEHPVLGSEVIFGPMWRMSSTKNVKWRHAPILGEHTESIMSDLLGISAEEYNLLVASEVLV